VIDAKQINAVVSGGVLRRGNAFRERYYART
jgi:hypothetical protein